ncbi:hypothetical protein ABPG72_011189 [Tetrahymena utriculariae]
MGNFLNQLKYTPQANPLLKSSLSKLREYHGSFKSVCDTFSIDLTEYEQIFGSNEQIFKIWDTDNNGLIDALELFSGLILFSDASFDEKVRFLFDIFDFNELNVLTIIDLEFMLISCANATLKIVKQNLEIKEDEINEFLNNYFSDDSKIDTNQLIKWCSKVPEIIKFLTIIEQKSPETKKPYENLIKTISVEHEPNSIKRQTYFFNKSLGDIINNSSYQKKIEWIAEKSKKIFNMNPSDQNYNTKDVSTKINWVYGFCSEGVKKPLEYLKTPGEKAASEKILYFTACIVVIYFPKLYEQKHYLEHDAEVLSLTVAKNASLVATGELAPKPAIHIWDSNTLQNLGVIKGIHQQGVHLMKFFKDDEYLATCGIRDNSPILIYNVKDSTLVLSTFMTELAVELISIDNHSDELIKKTDQNSQLDMDYFNYDNTFIVCSAKQLILFHYFDGHFITYDINFSYFDIEEDLTCATSVRIPYSKYSKVEDKKQENLILIITGHQNGRINIWKNFENQNQFIKKYEDDIISMVNFVFGILVATYNKVYLWDIGMQNQLKEISFAQNEIHFNLISYDIVQIKAFNTKVLAATKEGDVVQFEFVTQKQLQQIEKLAEENFFPEKKKKKKNTSSSDEEADEQGDDGEDDEENSEEEQIKHIEVYKKTFQRNNYISKLKGNLNALALLQKADNDEKILYAGGDAGIVYAFSLESHEIIDMWQYDGEISSLDYLYSEKHGNIFAVGFRDGRINIKYQNKMKQELYTPEKYQNFDYRNQINDIRFSGDGNTLIAACKNNSLSIFSFSVTTQNFQEKKEIITSFFAQDKKDIFLANEEPISIEFSDDNKSFLVSTAQNLYKFELPDLKKKNLISESDEQINCTIWNTRYWQEREDHQIEDYYLPVIIGGDIKIFLAAGVNGYIHFWKDKYQLEQNCGGFLRGHSSRVSRLCMAKTQDFFFSLGSTDNTLIEWKIDFSQEFEQKNVFGNMDNMKVQLFDTNIQQLNGLLDENLVREIVYSYTADSKYLEQDKDSFILVKGISNKTISQIYQEYIPKFEASSYLMKRPPSISISLEYLFGFQAYDKRRTLCYVHIYYMGLPQNKKKKDKMGKKNKNDQANQNKSILIPVQYQKEMLFSKRQLLPYDEVHENCQRHFVYFCGRIGVVFNPLTNQQKFYEGHQNKISCIAIHPLKFFVATGESAQNPKIHIWNVFNPEPFKILKTYHKNGIIHMTFSRDRDSSLLISVGVDVQFSIQVMNWKTEEIVGIRNTGSQQIFDIIFNPYNKYEFASCGYKNITLWEMSGRNLLRKKVVNVQEETTSTSICITCLSYISYSLGDQIESDIIAGNNVGDLILVACGKYIVAKERAHSKMINCLKITELFQDKVLIITCGEDEVVKIWDTKFNLIKDIPIRHTGHFNDIPQTRNLSGQSLDIFCCKYPKKADNESALGDRDSDVVYPIILIGTRNGDILEASFTLEYQGTKKQVNVQNKMSYGEQSASSSESSSASSDEDEDIKNSNSRKGDHYGQTESFKFSYEICMRNSSSQRFTSKQNTKKLFFSLHPFENLMATVGEDQQLTLIDFEQNKLMISKNLEEGVPTTVRFSPNGNLFVIGFNNGILKLYFIETGSSKSSKEHRPIPTITEFQEIRDQKTAVLNIKFSIKEYLEAKEDKELLNDRDDIFAVSYESQSQSADSQMVDKEQSYIGIYRPQLNQQNQLNYKLKETLRNDQIIRNENSINLGAYFMSFSEDAKYLVVYYQEIENQSIRITNSNGGLFCLWDIVSQKILQQYDPSRNWVDLIFPCALNCQDIPYFQSLVDQDQKKEAVAPANRDPQPIIMTFMNQIKNTIMLGSSKGNIHFVKHYSLSSDQEHNDYKLKEKDMCYAKSYSAHISYISQLEFDSQYRYLFSSSINDECILKWKLLIERPLSDYDNLDYQFIDEHQINLKNQEVLSEILPKDQFEQLNKDVLPLRDQVADAIQHVDEDKDRESELKLINIIGRKAHNRHQNLFYDFDERFIYIAGNNLVIHTIQDSIEDKEEEDQQQLQQHDQQVEELDDDEPFVKQEFIKLDQSPTTINPEISCFVLSKDKKLLCAGTCQIQAKIIIWDICSQTCLKQMILNNSNYILHIKMAYDNRHIVCVALSNDYNAIIYLIDSQESKVLGQTKLTNSVPYKIKDIEFFPNSIYKFITCGIQHISVWNLKGNILSYQNLEIQIPQDLADTEKSKGTQSSSIKQKKQSQRNLSSPLRQKKKGEDANFEEADYDESKEQIKVTFVSLIFVNETIITAGSDGFLYVWHDLKIVKTQNAHPILCLNTTKDSNMFASGGMDGKVIIWELGSSEYSFMLEKVYEYHINPEGAKEHYPESCYIQSVCIGSKYILAGTKSGDIYELIRPNENEIKNPTSSNNKQKLRYSCHDQEIVKSIQFNGNSDKLYTITENGLFCVWDVRKIKRIKMIHFHLKIHSIIVLKRYQIIVVASERKIQFFNQTDYSERNKAIVFDTKIADVKLSFNEEMLAVALDPNQKTNAKIIIYKYVGTDQDVFIHDIPVPIQSTSLEFVDFSTDNFFLLYKDNVDDVEIIDFRNEFKKVIKGEVEFNLEWCTDGIKVSPNMKGVLHTYYSDENSILKVQKIGDRQIAVTDEMGSIRLFSYPCTSQSKGYFKCYTDHLNFINQCILSPDKKYLVTSSQRDRCTLIWRVTYEDIYEREEDEEQSEEHQD